MKEEIKKFFQEHPVTDFYEEGYKKGYQDAINKACNYLLTHIDKDLVIYHEQSWKSLEQFINDFKKDMEE